MASKHNHEIQKWPQKILNSDWLSSVTELLVTGQYNRTPIRDI